MGLTTVQRYCAACDAVGVPGCRRCHTTIAVQPVRCA